MAEFFAPFLIGGHAYFASFVPPAAGGGTPTPTVIVAASRIARFAANPRVAAFSGKKPIIINKAQSDELRYVGDFTSDLTESGTTAVSVTLLPGAASVIGTPVVQGNLAVAKLSGIGSVVFRLVGANGEQWDRTIQLVATDDRTHIFGKDADDKLYYAFDFDLDAAMWATSLASIQAAVFNGVLSLATPFVSGNLAVVKVGGLNIANNAVNSVTLTALFANGEKITRSIYFVAEVH